MTSYGRCDSNDNQLTAVIWLIIALVTLGLMTAILLLTVIGVNNAVNTLVPSPVPTITANNTTNETDNGCLPDIPRRNITRNTLRYNNSTI